MLLSYSEGSEWGSVEQFYKWMESKADDTETIEFQVEVWGKLYRKDLKPLPGDGIAFYHTTKARFPTRDPYKRRPRISLIGEILEIVQTGQKVSWLSVRIMRSDLELFRRKPTIRDGVTEHLFQLCGMVHGSVATFYEIPPEVWAEFGKRPVREDSGSFGFFPDETPDGLTYVEGATQRISVNKYERDPEARERCVQHWGAHCAVCGIDFGDWYGERGVGFIHVHHLLPLAQIRAEYQIDPVRDLRPVCPNCHAMIHRKPPLLSIEELKQLLQERGHSEG
jgi:hypothetical protein